MNIEMDPYFLEGLKGILYLALFSFLCYQFRNNEALHDLFLCFVAYGGGKIVTTLNLMKDGDEN